MPFDASDSKTRPRYNAVARVLVGVVLVVTTILPLLFTIGVIAGVIWMIVDVVMQLVTGKEGWPNAMSTLSEWLSRLFYWPIDMVEWILFGTSDFPFLP